MLIDMSNTYKIVGFVLALALCAVLWVVGSAQLTKSPEPVACTMDAKICPDGSAVGRTGPNCEFAECPQVDGDTDEVTVGVQPVAIGQSVTVNGVAIGVLELLEDSRCPVDVQCIQAGTVRVRVAIDSLSSDFTLVLGEPQEINGKKVTLSAVVPAEMRSTTQVDSSDYRFTFTVAE